MSIITWEYIKEHLFLPVISPLEIAKKLTYHGLETRLIEKEKDIYFEFDVLPNRSDLISWWGIIQEIAIILNCQFKPINFPTVNKSEQKVVEVKIENLVCESFYLGFIRDVKISESSPLIKNWLKINGIQPINNIIDAANLVMLESGQPLHVFDYDSLPEKKGLFIRQAQEGESMTTIQGKKLVLNSQDILISSGEKLIDLAGIIGSKDTIITPRTQNILIECATFCPQIIKSTTKRLNFTTSASRYFCRKISSFPSPEKVLRRVISLIINSYGGNLTSGEFFAYLEAKKQEQNTIIITRDFIEKKTGRKFPELVIENIYKRLNFFYQKKENFYYVTIPYYRPDIITQEDLLEELLKIYDYNQVTGKLSSSSESVAFVAKNNENEKRKQEIKVYLTNCGWQEVITYSLVEEVSKEFKDYKEDSTYYKLLTPKNEYHQYYRQTLIPSHLKIIDYNLSHGNKSLFFFEISSVYYNLEKVKQEEQLLTLSGMGKFFNQSFHKLIQEIDFYSIKGVLENIFSLWQIEEQIIFSPTSASFLDSSQGAEIFLKQEKIGFLGQISLNVAGNYQVNKPVFTAQISLTKIFNYLNNFPHIIAYKPISNFPISERDLSFLFPEELDYNKVIKEIKKFGGNELLEVSIFDVFQSDEMSKKKQKSVSYRLVFQSAIKTLENKEIENSIIKIVERIKRLFNAELREK